MKDARAHLHRPGALLLPMAGAMDETASVLLTGLLSTLAGLLAALVSAAVAGILLLPGRNGVLGMNEWHHASTHFNQMFLPNVQVILLAMATVTILLWWMDPYHSWNVLPLLSISKPSR
ncbi:unnamed protein product [Closterium sp. Yama58-4]|nr:unnamed protein product [Closterium sp. Yama58-4]